MRLIESTRRLRVALGWGNGELADQVHHQRLPFDPLGRHTACDVFGGAGMAGLLTQVDEIEGIVVMSIGLVADLVKNRVRSNATKPILGVAEIAFASVHDAVPETALGTADVLADRMTAVNVTGDQPESAQTFHLACRRNSDQMVADATFEQRHERLMQGPIAERGQWSPDNCGRKFR